MRPRFSGIFAVLAACAVCAMPARAQSAWQPDHKGIGFAPAPAKQWVQMASSPELTVQASKSGGAQGSAELRFLINPGLHINSHTPNSKYLIPTDLKLDAPPGVQIGSIEYPQGVNYHLRFLPKETLSVYTGQFAVLVHVAARPGHYTLHGALRYQSCDDQACNPPRTLPLTLDLTAR